MDSLLPGYGVDQPTWFYLSLLLIISVFFRFNRIWSLRNLDLMLLLSIAPALLLIGHAETPGSFVDPGLVDAQSTGYVWLFVATGCLLLRTLLDASFTRRPRLPQNMNLPGLAFLCTAACVFLMTKAVTERPAPATVQEVRRAQQMVQGTDAPSHGVLTDDEASSEAGPGSRLIYAAVAAAQTNVSPQGATSEETRSELIIASTMAILAHLAVVVGLLCLGHWVFADLPSGLGMATLYVLLPCTAYDVGKVNHVLPAAFIVWAFVSYRRPVLAGCLLGLACGTLFFPVFLLPLWAGFFGRKGGGRFTFAVALIGSMLVGSQLINSGDTANFLRWNLGEIDWWMLQFREVQSGGFWSIYPSVYRIPVFVTFLVMLVILTIWPREKNLGDLMAHSTAIVVATQFWYPQQGGMYVLWYLPLLLMVVFRPQLTTAVPRDLPPLFGLGRAKKAPQPELVASSTNTGHLFR